MRLYRDSEKLSSVHRRINFASADCIIVGEIIERAASFTQAMHSAV